MDNKEGIEIRSPLPQQNECGNTQEYASSVKESKKMNVPEDIKSLVFFDAIGVQFHLSVFLYQLGVHLFLPFFFFVPNKSAQGLNSSFTAIWFNVFQPISVYVMIICYCTCSSATFNLLEGAIWMPLMYFLAHRIIIALKYASLSRTEYKKFCDTANDVHLSFHYRTQMQLISGWIALEPSVLYFEVGAASARMGIKINEMFVRICTKGKEQSSISQFRYWNAFVRGHDTIDWHTKPAPELQYLEHEQGYAISVYDIVLAVIRRANSTADPNTTYAYLFGCFVTFLVIVVSYFPFIFTDNHAIDAMLVLFFLSSTLISITFGPLFYYILYTSIFEVKRLLRMYAILHCMIRVTDLMMGSSLSLGTEDVTECDETLARTRADAILSIGKVDIGSIQAHPIPLRELERRTSNANVKLLQRNQSLNHKQTQRHHSTILTPPPPPLVSTSSFSTTTTDSTSTTTASSDEAVDNNSFLFGDATIDTGCCRESFVLGERLAIHNGYAMTPRISFEHPENVIAWVYCRLAIQNFGDRFRYRSDVYVGGTCIVAIILMLVSLLNILLADDRQVAFGDTLFIQSVITVTILIIFILLLFFFGSNVNEQMNLHKVTLASRTLILLRKKLCHYHLHREYAQPMNEKQSEYYQSITEVLQEALEILSINTELKPFKVLGMNAQITLVISIITASVTFYSTLITLYANTGNNFATSNSSSATI